MASRRERASGIIKEFGTTFPEELGIKVERNTPSVLFRLLCFSLLASARISHGIAMSAAKALARNGWTTVVRMHESTWRQRTDVLNRAGYARYDESTSRMLGDTSALLLDKYRGDLRKLRARAGGDVREMHRLLRECKGIGETGADLFLREVQLAWEEVYPFLDKRTAGLAKKSGLPDKAGALARLVNGRREYLRLVDGLVRKGYEKA